MSVTALGYVVIAPAIRVKKLALAGPNGNEINGGVFPCFFWIPDTIQSYAFYRSGPESAVRTGLRFYLAQWCF